jgi:hypothetical protein
MEHFRVAIFSSRSNQPGGILAMKVYVCFHFGKYWEQWGTVNYNELFNQIEWPTEKPAAFLSIDDRAITFTGLWPDLHELAKFKPWNKK